MQFIRIEPCSLDNRLFALRRGMNAFNLRTRKTFEGNLIRNHQGRLYCLRQQTNNWQNKNSICPTELNYSFQIPNRRTRDISNIQPIVLFILLSPKQPYFIHRNRITISNSSTTESIYQYSSFERCWCYTSAFLDSTSKKHPRIQHYIPTKKVATAVNVPCILPLECNRANSFRILSSLFVI